MREGVNDMARKVYDDWIDTATGEPMMAVRLNGEVVDVPIKDIMYVMHKGDVPDYTTVVRTCNEPMCVNPDHMELHTIS